MDAVLRALVIYFFLILLFRISGKRSLAQITTFDLLLLLIIAEATQQGLLGNDFSITNAFIVIGTLIGLELLLSVLGFRSKTASRVFDGTPLVLIENGRILHDRLKKSRVNHDDILEQARQTQGIGRFDQIKYAVLERNGTISIIPK